MKYSETFLSEAYALTEYLHSEQSLLSTLRWILELKNYQSQDPGKFIYKKENTRVFLAIVDDLEHLNTDYRCKFYTSLTADDIVVTDNLILRPTCATVINLPQSWFGIYSYTPEHTAPPDRAYSFKTRRIDSIRQEIFLELHYRLHHFEDGYVSFDCSDHSSDQSTESKQKLWHQAWITHSPETKQKYQLSFDQLSEQIPYTNHDIEIDQAYSRSMLNIVIETYSSEHAVALSEKTFRALVTPRLWTLYSGKHSVAYLRSLGFDVMDDLIDHNSYDTLSHNQDKVTEFIAASNPMVKRFDWQDIENRCNQAAEHNQNILSQFKQQWPDDFATWLQQFVQQV